MISIIETNKMTDLSVVSAACSLGLACSSDSSLRGTGMSGISAVSLLPLVEAFLCGSAMSDRLRHRQQQ